MASSATACSAGPIILLEKVVKNLTVPSSCLIDRNGKGEGAVMVVKDGKIHRVNVHVGMDTGLRAEIVDGLAENDQVILQPDPSIAEGTPVQVESVASPSEAATEGRTSEADVLRLRRDGMQSRAGILPKIEKEVVSSALGAAPPSRRIVDVPKSRHATAGPGSNGSSAGCN